MDTAASLRDETFDGSCHVTTSELLLLGLVALDHGHAEELFVHLGVEIEDE